jgi:hypothetical protein
MRGLLFNDLKDCDECTVVCTPPIVIILLGRGVAHCALAIYIKESLKEKERIMKTQNISPCKKMIFKKNLLKETTTILQTRYYNSIL